MSLTISKNNIELITNFCLTLDTTYLSTLDEKVKELFIKYSKKVMKGEKGYKNIAHIVLTFYNLFDDGTTKPFDIKKFAWPFKDDKIDCSKLEKIPVVKYRTTITINQINLQLLKSALQKYIRRNMTHKAIWCGLEWGLLRCDQEAEDKNLKSAITNLRNRLRIIYLEDISISNLNLLGIISTKIDVLNYDKNPSGKDMDKVIVDIVSNMSQSYHTRICSYVNSIYKIYNNKSFFKKQKEYLSYFPNVKNIYEYIQDHKDLSLKNNLLNSLKEKNPVCFYYAQELNFSENEKGKFGKNNEVFPIIIKVINDKYKKQLDICEKWYSEIKNSEAFLAYFIPMLIICFPVKEDGRLVDYFDYTPEWKNLVMYNIEEPAINLEQYTMDMHTKEGIRKGLKKDNLEGINNFIKQGAYVNNEYKINDLAIELKNYYEFTKLLSLGKVDETYFTNIEENTNKVEDVEELDIVEPPTKKIKTTMSENDFFEYIARAQVPTSGSKLDSYYSKMKEDYGDFKKGETVFVKGPFDNNKVYDILKLFIQMKKVMNIPYIHLEKFELTLSKDFFTGELNIEDNVGKGYIRNKLKKNETYSFIIYKNLCGDISHTAKYGYLKTQKSKAWIDTKATIVNWSKMDSKCHHFEVDDLKNEKYLIEYMEALYFRYLFGIVDAANRNFLIVDNRLYGIDEENIDMSKDSNFSKLGKQFEYINKKWSKVSDKIVNILKEWNNRLPEIEKILNDKIYSGFVKRLNKLIKNPKLFLILEDDSEDE